MAGIQSRQAQGLIEPRANDELFYPPIGVNYCFQSFVSSSKSVFTSARTKRGFQDRGTIDVPDTTFAIDDKDPAECDTADPADHSDWIACPRF